MKFSTLFPTTSKARREGKFVARSGFIYPTLEEFVKTKAKRLSLKRILEYSPRSKREEVRKAYPIVIKSEIERLEKELSNLKEKLKDYKKASK